MENEMKLEIKSNPCNEEFASATVIAFISQINPSLEEMNDIKVSVSEAVRNSIIHAYDSNEGIIQIKCSIVGKIVRIEVTDYGKGIRDVETAMEPSYTSKPELDGMGFFVMETFMGELKVESAIGVGTKVFLEKTIW